MRIKKLIVAFASLSLTTGFFYQEKNPIAIDHRNIKECEEKFTKNSYHSCYQKVISTADLPINISPNEQYETEKRIEEIKKLSNDYNAALSHISKVEKSNPNYQQIIYMSGFFEKAEELATKYGNLTRNIDNLKERKSAIESRIANLQSMNEKYAGVDPAFRAEILKRISRYEPLLLKINSNEQFIENHKPFIQKAIETYNFVANTYNEHGRNEQAAASNYAKNNNLNGFIDNPKPLLDGAESAKKFINYLVYFDEENPYRDAGCTSEKLCKFIPRSNSNVVIYVDFEDGNTTRDLSGMYLVVKDIKEYENAIGEKNYVLYFTNSKFKNSR